MLQTQPSLSAVGNSFSRLSVGVKWGEGNSQKGAGSC